MKLSIKKIGSLLLIASLLVSACEGPGSAPSPSQPGSVQQQSSPAAQPGVQQQSSPFAQPASSKLLDEAADDRPLVAGHYVFWYKAFGSATSTSEQDGRLTYGYDLQARQSFVVKQVGNSAQTLFSDGVDLLWWAVSPGASHTAATPVQSIALESVQDGNAPTKLATAPPHPGTIFLEAYDQGILYYNREADTYGYNLNTGVASMVGNAAGLVVHKGVLLWQDELPRGYHESRPSRLHLQTSQLKDTVIAQDDDYSFNNYSIDGNNVVWSSGRGTYLYDISKQTTTRLTVEPAEGAMIAANHIAWVGSEGAAIAGDNIAWVAMTYTSEGTPYWSVLSYDLKSGQSRVVVASSTAHLYVDGVTAQGDLVYSVENPTQVRRALYLTNVGSSNAGYDKVVRTNQLVPDWPIPLSCLATQHRPTSCGQVSVTDQTNFSDVAGVWRGRGVQVFLPEYELGGESFFVRNYFDPDPKKATPELPYGPVNPDVETLLNAAQHGVKANFVRIFVDLPGDSSKVASIDAILNFLTAANIHQLRVGIVMHNSSRANPNMAYFRDNYFKMDLTGTPLVLPSCAGRPTTPTPTPTPVNQIRKQWIQAFITCVTNKNLSDVVAYVSADNEINNHCNQTGIAYDGTTPVEGRVDCFAASQFPGYDALAQRWVREFNALFVGTGIMTTVGLSTEMYTEGRDDGPATPEPIPIVATRFFDASTGEQSLNASVTFLSPHNYGGKGLDIKAAIGVARGPNPLKPVVLEEYGHATDPLAEGVASSNTATPATSSPPSISHPENTEGKRSCLVFYIGGRSMPVIPFYCYKVASYFIGVNALSIRTNGYAGGAAFMLTDVYPAAGQSCKKPDYYTGLYSIGLVSPQGKKIRYCCGTYTTYAAGVVGLSDMSKRKLTGDVVLSHHQLSWLGRHQGDCGALPLPARHQ